MAKTLKGIIDALGQNEEFSRYTYVGKNYNKQDLIDDLLALRANYSYSHSESSIEPPPRKVTGKFAKARKARIKKLMVRDGIGCFYCNKELNMKKVTIEHLESTSKGGSNALINLRLSCHPCNLKAGNLSVPEKLKLRVLNAGVTFKHSDYTEIKRSD